MADAQKWVDEFILNNYEYAAVELERKLNVCREQLNGAKERQAAAAAAAAARFVGGGEEDVAASRDGERLGKRGGGFADT